MPATGELRREVYEISNAIAPTWERRRGYIGEVPGRFASDDVEEYLEFAADTAGPPAAAVRRLPEEERTPIKARLEEACAPFATDAAARCPSSPSPRWRAERPADHTRDHRRRRKRHGDEVARGEGAARARAARPAHGR